MIALNNELEVIKSKNSELVNEKEEKEEEARDWFN